MVWIGRPGAMAWARSVMRIEGMRGTKISPPRMRAKFSSTKSTPCCSVIQKRVMRSSVMGRLFAPSAIRRSNSGTTEPREPTTLPYRTAAKRVRAPPTMLLAATNSLSEASLVAPYRLIGFAALSVDRAITLSTSLAMAARITFSAPCTFVLMHSMGLYSAAGTCLRAAAWIT